MHPASCAAPGKLPLPLFVLGDVPQPDGMSECLSSAFVACAFWAGVAAASVRLLAPAGTGAAAPAPTASTPAAITPTPQATLRAHPGSAMSPVWWPSRPFPSRRRPTAGPRTDTLGPHDLGPEDLGPGDPGPGDLGSPGDCRAPLPARAGPAIFGTRNPRVLMSAKEARSR